MGTQLPDGVDTVHAVECRYGQRQLPVADREAHNRGAIARDGFEKQDRIGRLLHELLLLHGSSRGLTSQEIGERMDISRRTAQRDLRALEEIGVPLLMVGARWRLVDGYFLPPVKFSLQEAMGLLLSARLMLRYADRQNRYTAMAYEKVAAILPESLRQALLETATALTDKAEDVSYTKVLAALTTAWAERRKVVITYTMERTFERTVWPLFLEPSAIGHTCYLIAYDEKVRAIRSYKVERISGVRATDQRFDPPLGFSVSRHLANAWMIWASEKPVDVELRFSAAVAKRVLETGWHPSQSLQPQADGSVVMRLRVASTTEIKHWVLGWGAACEVIAPEDFRSEIGAELEAMAQLYRPRSEPMVALHELVSSVTGPTVRATTRRGRNERAAG
jgi:predicted DNA-binding transcriptional regulator YafY